MIIEEIRSYEVSLWTLLDEFITVLKWSNAEQKGRIEDPEMNLDVDGTESFSFSIPMYINNYDTGETTISLIKTENPIWYNTKNGNLIEGMRKIKVIFNKMTADECVYEFLITKVTEEHQLNLLSCKVECEGLAFHELGKIGYKFDLSGDNFILDYESWKDTGSWTKADGTIVYTEPKESVDYWCELCLLLPWNSAAINPRKWYYKIEMNWNTSSKIAQNNTGNIITRDSTKVYEDSYNTSWDANLNPLKTETAREKFRAVSINESNIYNITLTIAETFNIYCKYEYGHDENYHITSRVIIFYNNYFAENKHVLGLTYPYSSKSVTRELDSTELTTKMYVRTDDDDTILGGSINIADSPANRMKEDYLMNFEYMYKHNAITDEQYAEINKYEKFINNINTEINTLAAHINACELQKIDIEARIAVLNESLVVALEQLDTYRAKYNSIDSADGNQDGYFERKEDTNYSTLAILDKSNNRYYINLNEQDKGIDLTTLKVYKTYTSTAATGSKMSNPVTISSGDYIKDKYGDIYRIYIPNNTFSSNDYKKLYLVYKYKPKMYYDTVINTWAQKKTNMEDELSNANTGLEKKLADLEDDIDTTTANYNAKLTEKKLYIRKFEEMMGPALREGYWLPDSYSDYGEQKEKDGTIPGVYDATKQTEDAGDDAIIYWDTKLFNEEDDIYYEEGVELEKVYYPCIDISGQLTTIATLMNDSRGKLAFVFNNNYYKTLTTAEAGEVQNLSNFTLGGKMKLGFIHITDSSSSTIKPVLILIGTKNMTDDEIKFMLSSTGGNPRLCVFNITTSGSTTTLTMKGIGNNDPITVSSEMIYWDTNKLSSVNSIISTSNQTIAIAYPRIKFSNPRLKLTSEYLGIKYGLTSPATVLTRYEDYSVLSHITIRNNNNYDEATLEYFVTIKPEVFFNAIYNRALNESPTIFGKVNIKYTFSNAATSIYLDACKILKENSEPKVSYSVEINIIDREYLKTLYNTLAQLVIINDVDLKFEDEYGYISHIDLNLDKPWEDTIEVKNYKTKFEDLFSTIVAQTEDMKKNSAAFGSAAVGDVALSADALEETLSEEKYNDILQEFFDRMFSSSLAVEEKLRNLFTEAGNILSSANTSLSTVRILSSENLAILDSFTNRIVNEMTPNVYNSVDQPTQFKVGDIWNEVDDSGAIVGKYVATMDSMDGNAGGWTRVYDGRIAAITGASLEIDTVAGTIDILAKNNINITSANVDITANKAVNIGGATINIGSYAIGNTTYIGGINLVATAYNTNNFSAANQSKVIIKPNMISLGGSTIEMYSGNSVTGTSALRLDGANGIYIGSSNKVVLYSGTNYSAANIELSPTRILFGVSNSASNTTAIEATSSYIIFAAGDVISNLRNGAIATTNTNTGVKITSTSIGISVGSGTRRSIVTMNSDGLIIGAGTDANGTIGSSVTITGKKVDISSGGNLLVDTTNLLLKSDQSGSNIAFRLGTDASPVLSYSPTGGLVLSASSVKIGSESLSTYISSLISVTDDRIWAGVKNATSGSTTALTLTDGSVSVDVDANNYVHINTDGIDMKGKHIYINGEKEWSRDDIIVLKRPNATGYEDQTTIETRMRNAGRTDWVLIKPYYDATLDFSWSGSASIPISETSNFILTSTSQAPWFGTTTSYAYKLVVSYYNPNNNRHFEILLYALKESDPNTKIYIPITTDTLGTRIIYNTNGEKSGEMTPSDGKYIIVTNRNRSNMVFLPLSSAIALTNLCQEGYIIYVSIRDTNGGSYSDKPEITEINLRCTCDEVTGKVPCTVFYYP